MKNTTIAIDLAKSVFEVGISDRPGHVSRNHRLSRSELSAFLAMQPPATVVMEACSSSHYWGRKFQSFGHEVKLLPPLYVRPYVHRSKTDRSDVKGMLEAWRNSDIRAVPIKTESQQQLTSLHRVRSTWMAARTMRMNSARGLLREFGIVFAAGAAKFPDHVQSLTRTPTPRFPCCSAICCINSSLRSLNWNHASRLLKNIWRCLLPRLPSSRAVAHDPGVGLLTATALVGFVGDVARFPSGRHFAC